MVFNPPSKWWITIYRPFDGRTLTRLCVFEGQMPLRHELERIEQGNKGATIIRMKKYGYE